MKTPKKEKPLFLQSHKNPKGNALVYPLQTKKECTHYGDSPDTCTICINSLINSPSPTDRILESWEKEFDKEFTFIDDETTVNVLGTELSNELKSFISQKLLSARQETIKEIIEIVKNKKLKPEGLANALNYEETGFNQALQEIKQSLEKLKTLNK